jgi:hypothetical protein
MGGLWQALAFGFAGLRARGGVLEVDPQLPADWRSLEMRLAFRGRRVRLDIEQYTNVDERLLYLAVSERLGDPLVTVSMNYDRLAIRHWISKIAAADVTDTDRLQRLLYGLDALIRVHIWKDNELFLALLEESPRSGSGC